MHDTAFQIGTLAMNIYADLRKASVLEVGSKAVNGSLRENALPTTRYVGVDIEEGEGVDVVAEPGKPLPVDDNSFDLVMASSVFEHDAFFWLTFLEMCRVAKEGGYIYVNAPSNGVVHRYPQDHWRFYPDCAKALAQWANSQGQSICVIESFVADRGEYVWNDFVAVFRKGRLTKRLPKVSIYEHVPCSNVITWKSKEILNPKEFPQDLELLGEAAESIERLELALATAENQREALAQEMSQLAARTAEAERDVVELKTRIASTEAESRRAAAEAKEAFARQLMCLQGELERARSDQELARAAFEQEQAAAAAAKESMALLHIQLDKRSEQLAALNQKLNEKDSAVTEARECIAELEEAIEAIQDESRRDIQAAELRVNERFCEIVEISRLLDEREQFAKRAQGDAQWLRETGSVLLNGTNGLKGRLLSLLPAALYQKHQRRLLEKKGLFDAGAYLAAHRDVALEGADPLMHYLSHGIGENRRRS